MSSEFNQKLGALIKKKRIKKALTQEQLEEKVGFYSRFTIYACLLFQENK